MGISENIADFVFSFRQSDLSGTVLLRAKEAVLDYVGVVMTGIDEQSASQLRFLINDMGGNAQASIWRTGIKTSVPFAAMVNAATAHALDYDDTNSAMLAHPSIHLLPGLFSLAEEKHSSGLDILTAYVVGFETGVFLGRLLNPEHVKRGWLPIGTIGPVMQAVACSKLLELNRGRIEMALGHAVNTSSGLRCNNGSMAKHLLAGQASFNGVMAALYAKRGITASPSAMEDAFGYLAVFGGNSQEKMAAAGSLDKASALIESGLCFKLYPCCAAAHGAIDCALALAGRIPFKVREIEKIVVSMHASFQRALIHPRPTTLSEARFSLGYCVARAFLDGEFGPRQFHPEKFKDSLWKNLAEKIEVSDSEFAIRPEDVEKSRFPLEITVFGRGEKTVTERIEYAKGTPHNPLHAKDLEEKFRRCCGDRLSSEEIDSLLGKLRKFEEIEDVWYILKILQ